MVEKIKLDNNYYLEVENNVEESYIDVSEISLNCIKKRKCLMFKIDFKKLNRQEYKKTIKKLFHIKKYAKLFKTKIGKEQANNEKLLGCLLNYDENDEQQKAFVLAINAVFYKTRLERYNYIYDTVCDYLNGFFYGKNLCGFENNKCAEKRNTSSTCGCCRHGKIRCLGPLTKLVVCEYLKDDYTCGAQCIGCKLFTCDYLQKKGIKFRIKDILLLDAFFNPIQKYFIKYMVFTPKEEIIKRLMLT